MIERKFSSETARHTVSDSLFVCWSAGENGSLGEMHWIFESNSVNCRVGGVLGPAAILVF